MTRTTPQAAPLTWPGPRLLVPADVEALVLTTDSANDRWSWGSVEYDFMSSYLDVDPRPFNETKPTKPDGTPLTGVVLHWALPDGLTHGVRRDDEADITYPVVPNRWLVTRISPDATAPDGRKLTAWVVESDYLGDEGTNSFPKPNPSTVGEATLIGRRRDYDGWKGDDGAASPWLTAIGPGTATFAAFSIGTHDVFSLIDPLDDVPKGPLTYSVIGWYSDPKADPMFGASYDPEKGWTTKDEWDELMSGFRWSVGDEEDLEHATAAAQKWLSAHGVPFDPKSPHAQYAAQTLVTGMVFGVVWDGPHGASQSGIPKVDMGQPDTIPQIAIGNTAIDALAAMMEAELGADGPQASELLEALQYSQLKTYDEPGGQAQLDRTIHDAWFGTTPSGTVWSLELPRDGEDGTLARRRGRVRVRELADPIPGLLAQLNDLQSQTDVLARKVSYLRFQVYLAWWRLGAYDADPPEGVSRDQLVKELAALEQELGDAIADLDDVDQRRLDVKAQLVKAIGKTYVLIDSPTDPFRQQSDPTILVYGARRGERHGEDGRFDSDGEQTFVRFSGESIGALAVTSEGDSVVVGAEDVPVTDLPEGAVPLEVFDLLREVFYLDTTTAAVIAERALEMLKQPVTPERIAALAEVVAKQQSLIWNPDVHSHLDRHTIAEVAGLDGTIPSKLSVTPYAPPWAPLYMDWRIRFYPSFDEIPKFLESWSFDGIDFQWTGGTPGKGNALAVTGRTLLTPQSQQALGSRLEEFLAYEAIHKDKEFEEAVRILSEVVERVHGWDLLSQVLTGFSDGLDLLDVGTHLVAPPDVEELVQDQGLATPRAAEGPGKFFPVRAGHWTLEGLVIVDDFGQVFDPIKARGQTPDNFEPYRGRGLVTEDQPRMMQAPPRLNQPLNMGFELASAADPRSVATLSDTPICGWLLPNHLDRGVSIYDATGQLLGELILAGRGGGLSALWSPVPGTAAPLGAPPDIADPTMAGFVAGLLDRSDRGDALAALLEVIDSTLWSIDPLGGRDESNLSLLIGRPLALVRATLGFTLSHPPAYNQSWSVVVDRDTGGFEKVPLPIRLGSTELLDDGLLGYFLDDDFSQFVSVHTPSHEAKGGYVVQRDVMLPASGDQTASLALLWDPRGDAHASAGLVPVQVRTLADSYIGAALEDMTVTFRTGPLLSDPQNLRMPIPANVDGDWAWAQRRDSTSWEDDALVIEANPAPRLDDAQSVIREGWLKLTGDFATDET